MFLAKWDFTKEPMICTEMIISREVSLKKGEAKEEEERTCCGDLVVDI